MTNPAPIIAEPLIAPPRRIARRRYRIFAALMGFYLFLAFAAPILTDKAGLLLLRSGWWRDADQHWLYGCMILIGGWVALGPGWMPLRALQGLLGIGWLLLIWLVGLTISPNWKFELELTTLVSLTVAATTFAVLIVDRLASGRRLVQADGTSGVGTRRFQYSLTTLLFVMLLVGVSITLFGWIDPKYLNDAALTRAESLWFYPVWRKAITWEVGSEALGPLVIAAVCLLAFLSNRWRALAWIPGLFAVALVVLPLKDANVRDYIFYPHVPRNVWYSYYIDHYFLPGMADLAAVTVCLCLAAAAMHWLGYRIQREDPRPGPLPRGERATPDTLPPGTAHRWRGG